MCNKDLRSAKPKPRVLINFPNSKVCLVGELFMIVLLVAALNESTIYVSSSTHIIIVFSFEHLLRLALVMLYIYTGYVLKLFMVSLSD